MNGLSLKIIYKYAHLKRCVFSILLKLSKDSQERIQYGKSFQICGPLKLKALSPKRVRTLGTSRTNLSLEDRRDLPGVYKDIMSHKYCGANLWMHLKHSTAILYLIR